MTRKRRLRAVAPRIERRVPRRLLTIGVAAVLAVLIAAMSSQYAKTYTLAREKARLEQRRRDLIADNARLRDEIERLQTDDRYIEQIAREQLGLVRPGEIELLVVPYDGTVSAPGTARRTSAPAQGLDRGFPAGEVTGTAPEIRPRRGIGEWAVGVRDAVLRLLRTVHR